MNVLTAKRMIGAELLKLRRNRGVMGFVLLLTVGVVVLLYGFSAVEHASDPARNQPAGGMHGFSQGVRALGVFFGMLAAVLIGAEAGTADRSSGVFRDLVVTGRARLALFAVRMPAAAMLSLGFSAVAYAIVLVATFVFAGGTPTPGIGLIVQAAGWIALANIVVSALAVGVGSLSGSRAVTLTAVIGWQVVVTNLLINVTALGSARDVLMTPALTQLMPVSGGDRGSVAMATGVAVVVLAGWLLIPLALGGWRTQTQDA